MALVNKAGYEITTPPTAPNSILEGSADGGAGVVFIPSVRRTAANDGYILSWTNDGGMENPPAVTIPDGKDGKDGQDASDLVVTNEYSVTLGGDYQTVWGPYMALRLDVKDNKTEYPAGYTRMIDFISHHPFSVLDIHLDHWKIPALVDNNSEMASFDYVAQLPAVCLLGYSGVVPVMGTAVGLAWNSVTYVHFVVTVSSDGSSSIIARVPRVYDMYDEVTGGSKKVILQTAGMDTVQHVLKAAIKY